MATIQERNGSYRILFVYRGKRESFTLGKVPQQIAEAKVAKTEEVLALLKNGYITVPIGVPIADFIQHEGKPPEAPVPQRDALTLAQLRDSYLKTHKNGTLEESTIDGIELHFKHLVATLGENLPVHSLQLGDLQRHVERRAKMKGIKGRKLSPATIRKEIVSLRTAWNWAVKMGSLAKRFPYDGLRYPKTDAKPPFMTWQEIQLQLSGLKPADQADLWDCLFLTPTEISQFLRYVHDHANLPWIYPAICFAAHTGARRSEIFRVRLTDVDLKAETVLIHEKKRLRGQRTTRRVPISPFLAGVLQEWIAAHPGGPFLFSQPVKVVRSKTKRTVPTQITRDEAHDHFQRTIRGGKWKVLKGWHVLRHSFISCCANRGVDQRLIDAWVGHTTEEMRRRYRHLIPSTEKRAIRSVFG